MGYDYSVPLTAFLFVAVLAVLMRWTFRPSRPRTGRPTSGPGADLGLLTAVLHRAGRRTALDAKDLLSAQGIRCSVSRVDPEVYDVLVFTPDAERARALLAP